MGVGNMVELFREIIAREYKSYLADGVSSEEAILRIVSDHDRKKLVVVNSLKHTGVYKSNAPAIKKYLLYAGAFVGAFLIAQFFMESSERSESEIIERKVVSSSPNTKLDIRTEEQRRNDDIRYSRIKRVIDQCSDTVPAHKYGIEAFGSCVRSMGVSDEDGSWAYEYYGT